MSSPDLAHHRRPCNCFPRKPAVAQEVADATAEPPGDVPYQRLKRKIPERAMPLRRVRLQQLLTGEQLSNRLPSQLLCSTGNLLDECDFVRLVLAATEKLSLDRLAAFADNVCEVLSPTVTAVSEAPDNSAEERIGRPTTLTRHQNSPRPRRCSSRNDSSRNSSTSPIYWYYRMFPHNARHALCLASREQ
ncbi:hypothetical protein HPB49_000274 [Dermacentor silvarum]|uniref:Uncharacterized protein n=1 Tax=Dermacentor silvarum TaxID=543639 RepID=A0ACB8DMC5_DERSI|nr:hypothetical protein HPB49_000274 [Dermacentor silvarum]